MARGAGAGRRRRLRRTHRTRRAPAAAAARESIPVRAHAGRRPNRPTRCAGTPTANVRDDAKMSPRWRVGSSSLSERAGRGHRSVGRWHRCHDGSVLQQGLALLGGAASARAGSGALVALRRRRSHRVAKAQASGGVEVAQHIGVGRRRRSALINLVQGLGRGAARVGARLEQPALLQDGGDQFCACERATMRARVRCVATRNQRVEPWPHVPAQKKLVPSVCRGQSRLLAMPVLENGLPTHCVLA